MSNLNSMQSQAQKSGLNQAGINRLIQVLASTALIGVLLFVCTGRMDWMAARAFLALSTIVFATAGVYAVRKNPEVVNERGKGAKGARRAKASAIHYGFDDTDRAVRRDDCIDHCARR